MGLSATDIATKYPLVKDCFSLEKQLNIIRQDMDYYYSRLNDADGKKLKSLLREREELFNVLGCKQKVSDKLISETKAIADKYSEIAKNRINIDNNSMRIVYLSIGTITLLTSTYFVIKYFRK